MKTTEAKLTRKLRDRIIEYYGKRLVSLVIFGSLARGKAGPESDIDILIIAEGLHKRKMKRIDEFIDNIEDKLGDVSRYLSPVIKAPEEASLGSPLFLDMVYDSLILYDKDGFFMRILDRLRRRLDELGSKRVFRGNRWYWILKPDYKPGDIIEL